MTYYNLEDVRSKARGNWKSIMTSLGVFTSEEVDRRKGIPCPSCGGNDRFSYNDYNGDGLGFCRQCDLKDPFKIIMAAKTVEFKEALKLVAHQLGIQEEKPKQDKKPIFANIIIPAPEKLSYTIGSYLNLPNGTTGKPSSYKYTHIWEWFDHDKFIGYIARQKNKSTHQIYYSNKGWVQGSPFRKGTRPMFGSETLDPELNDIVYVVEGEKTQQAVQNAIFGCSVITWVGGAAAVDHTDFADLNRFKKVIFCPDNDETGRKAMKKIQARLNSSVEISIMEAPADVPEHWDLADYTGGDMQAFVEEYLISQQTQAIQEEKVTENNKTWLRKQIRPLGFNNKKCYFIPSGQLQVVELGMSELSKSTLKILARTPVWNQVFQDPDDATKTNWDAAADWVLNECEKMKVYDMSNLRGTGAWWDKDKEDIVIHLGDKLLVNNKEIALNQYESKYVYSQRPRNIKMPNLEITMEERLFISETSKLFHWKQEEAAVMTNSFILLSPIAGLLKWRPSLWYLGEAGCGKSTMLNTFIKTCLKDISICPEGDSTEAGIRNWVQSDSLAVIFDEPEGDTAKVISHLENIIKLVRSNASSSEGMLAKGTQNQTGIRYQTQCMFAFASINCLPMKKQDRDRITQIEMLKNNPDWPELDKRLRRIPQDIDSKIYKFVVDNARRICDIVDEFRKYMSKKFDSDRIGDQFGSLAVSDYILLTEDLHIPTEKEIDKMVDQYAWDMVEDTHEYSNESQFLEFFRNVLVTTQDSNGKRLEFKVSELIAIASQRRASTLISTSDAERILNNRGIYIGQVEGTIYFASNSIELKKFFADEPMFANYKTLLMRLPGAEKARKRIDNQQIRVIEISVNTFISDKEEIQVDDDIPF